MRRFLPSLLALVAGLLLPAGAHAGEVLFSGSGAGANGVTLNASALFKIEGTTLTITLANAGDTSGAGSDVSANTLTGLFFDLPDGIVLTPVSAAVAPGAVLQPDQCNAGACDGSTTNVGGEFGYATGTYTGPHAGATHGISSSGYIPGTTTNFNGPNLDDPVSLNGANFGIVAPLSATNTKFKPNGGLTNDPLILGQVVLSMTIAGGPLLESQISNVSFQYGTGFNEPGFGGCCAVPPPPPPGVPEPAALLLLGPAAALAIRRFRRTT